MASEETRGEKRLYKRCTCNVETYPGKVRDPFCGSGTTLAVAKALGRSFIGIDLKEEYREMSRERLKRITRPLSPIDSLEDALKAIRGI